MVSQEEKAKIRFKVTKAIIRDAKEMEAETLFAMMLEQYGVKDRTTATYLKAMVTLKEIELKADKIIWIGHSNENQS